MLFAMKHLARFFVLVLGTAISLAAVAAPAPADQEYFSSETGYRISRYRAPTPETVDGGTRINIDELDRLVSDERAVLIDVMVAEGAGVDPKSGVWRLSKPRTSLPGAVWLADVGRGRLTQELHAYFARNLARLTNQDKAHPVIIFCMADCWMSWNAVRRAAALGYTRIYWYPEGTDGWRDWDRPFVTAVPRPLIRTRVAQAAKSTTDAGKSALPTGEKTVTLVSHDGTRVDIAKVHFRPASSASHVTFTVKLIDAPFKDEFLSMRPFRCLPDSKELWCHLAYPYANKHEISASDLQDLEYTLLFLFKPPTSYGIDAWNGLYFKLTLDNDGSLSGTVHETDMNVLAVPPDAKNLRPISHDGLTEVEPDAHRFHRIEIR